MTESLAGQVALVTGARTVAVRADVTNAAEVAAAVATMLPSPTTSGHRRRPQSTRY